MAEVALQKDTPTTWPCRSTRGPPELPLLIATSVWMYLQALLSSPSSEACVPFTDWELAGDTFEVSQACGVPWACQCWWFCSSKKLLYVQLLVSACQRPGILIMGLHGA